MLPTPEEQAVIDAALKKATENLQGNSQTVMTVYGNGIVKSQDSSIKVVKGSQ